MKILICSDGTAPSGEAVRLGSVVAAATRANVTLLGIAEAPDDKAPLQRALETQAKLFHETPAEVAMALSEGEPVAEIAKESARAKYDLIIVGARRTTPTGLYWRSQRMYELVKALPAPVLVAMGDRQNLSNIIVCTGGKNFIEPAVLLTGQIASALKASVTLLHVMAEPPAIYADLVALEEDVDNLLKSKSELGRNLSRQKEALEKLGVPTKVRITHGLVVEKVFDEIRSGNFDLVVTGSSRARGPLRHYIMGDVTRSILNAAECPVLVARSERLVGGGGFLRKLLGI